MKIAYLVHLNLDDNTGVFKKIASQAKAWREMGSEVCVFLVTRNARVVSAIDSALPRTVAAFYRPESVRERLEAFAKVIRAIEKNLPDVVYLRRDFFYPHTYRLLGLLPTIIEINSEELIELWLHNKAQWFYHKLTRPIIDRRVKGMVFVTEELAVKGYYGKLRLLKAVVANGINLKEYPILPVSNEPRPNLLFLASPALWHGIDKVVFLAKRFPLWRFHLVGFTPGDLPEVPKNVYCYGRLSFEEYLPIAARCHVGIGTLALHRKGLSEASPLKVREYLALGLPVIIGYKDTDFTGEEPFICQIPNTEDNVVKSLEKIENFVLLWMRQRVERECITHLDYEVKERKRLEFMEKVVRELQRK